MYAMRSAMLAAVAALAMMSPAISPAWASDEDDCAEKSGDVAIAACSRAIAGGKLSGKNLAIMFYNRGIEYRAKGDYNAAIADYGSALSIDPKYVAAWNNRGLAKKEAGDIDGSIRDYSEAIRLNPDYAFGYNNRGVSRRDKGDLDGALSDLTNAIRIDPDYVAAYTNRGIIHERKGDKNSARADFAQALMLPDKHSNSKWAKDTAQDHLRKMSQ